jgi:outer membrane protein OmpA-like peptidoglycan-associated protein
MPDTFVFAAVRNAGGPIALAGSVPATTTATDFGALAGGAKTDKLTVDTGLPPDFATSGSAGLTALSELLEGRLGFDGDRWWLRGKTEQQATATDASAKVAALPGGSAWSVSIDVLAPIDACRVKVGAIATRNAVVFQAGKATLMPSSIPVLDELAGDLAACPDTYVHVQGHTDSDGDADSNLVLSVSRAETVVAELVKRGVSDSRLYAEGFGESDPIASNDTKDGKAKNRRITFEITPE